MRHKPELQAEQAALGKIQGILQQFSKNRFLIEGTFLLCAELALQK
jgi:hypothetical protein